MHIGVIGKGVVGGRAIRLLRSKENVTVTEPPSSHRKRLRPYLRTLRQPSIDVLILATPQQVSTAAQYLSQGVSVVTTADSLSEVENLLALDSLAKTNGASLILGATFSPGLSCLLAVKAASGFQLVEEIHVNRAGAGGRACAKSYHRSLRQRAIEWYDGSWRTRSGGSGRELCWFPDPIGPVDCCRAGLPEPLLLQAVYPRARRIVARRAARRQDRWTSNFPMLMPPPAEGGVGAVRVEVRGSQDGEPSQTVLGAVAKPGAAAAAVAVEAAVRLASGELVVQGATGLAGLVDPHSMLKAVRAHGVSFWSYEGSDL